jgi:hypothetical protein
VSVILAARAQERIESPPERVMISFSASKSLPERLLAPDELVRADCSRTSIRPERVSTVPERAYWAAPTRSVVAMIPLVVLVRVDPVVEST